MVREKKWWEVLLLLLVFGCFGAHQFYMGRPYYAVCIILACTILFPIGFLMLFVDFITLPVQVAMANNN